MSTTSTPKKILSFLSPSPSSLFQTNLSARDHSPLTTRRKSTFNDLDDFFKNSYIKSRKVFLNPDTSYLIKSLKGKNKNSQKSIQFSKKSFERTSSIKENKEDVINKMIKQINGQQAYPSKENEIFLKELLKEPIEEKQKIELAINLLQKPSSSRSKEDLVLLASCMSKIRFFIEKGFEVLLECCKHLKVLTFEANETIFKEGSYGSMFYIILKGSVLLYKQTHNADNQSHSMELLKILNEGSSFGELALIEKRPRAATLICKEYGVFAVLEKKDFQNILMEIEKRKMLTEMEFFAKFDIFKDWSWNSIKSLYLDAFLLNFVKGNVVIEENKKIDCFYLIKEGEFEVSKKINEKDLKKDLKLMRADKPRFNFNSVQIIILTKGNFFGEEELINNISCITTIKCISIFGSLYAIKKKDFLSTVMQADNKKLLLDNIKFKQNLRESRLKLHENIQEEVKKNLKIKTPKKKSNKQLRGIKEAIFNYFSIDKMPNPIMKKKLETLDKNLTLFEYFGQKMKRPKSKLIPSPSSLQSKTNFNSNFIENIQKNSKFRDDSIENLNDSKLSKINLNDKKRIRSESPTLNIEKDDFFIKKSYFQPKNKNKFNANDTASLRTFLHVNGNSSISTEKENDMKTNRFHEIEKLPLKYFSKEIKAKEKEKKLVLLIN